MIFPRGARPVNHPDPLHPHPFDAQRRRCRGRQQHQRVGIYLGITHTFSP